MPSRGILEVYIYRDNAKVPTKATSGSIGYDLYAYLPIKGFVTIQPMSGVTISTGIAITAPPHTYARIASRSGLMSRHKVFTPGGIIDNDYNGEIKVVLYNFSTEPFAVVAGMRIAQLVLERYESPRIQSRTFPITITATSAAHNNDKATNEEGVHNNDMATNEEGDQNTERKIEEVRNDRGFGSTGLF